MTINDLEISENGIISTKKNYALKCYERFSSENTAEYLKVMVSIANSNGGFIVFGANNKDTISYLTNKKRTTTIVFGAKTKNNKSKSEFISSNSNLSLKDLAKNCVERFVQEYIGEVSCSFYYDQEQIKKEIVAIKVNKCADFVIRIVDSVILLWAENKIKEQKVANIIDSTKKIEIKKRMTFQPETKKAPSYVYQVASAKTNKEYLYKYMTLDVFLRCIKSGNILFQEPSEWKDQFEKRFYTAEYKKLKLKDKFPKQVFATCMTETQDCEAPWKVYANENVVFGKCLEIKINAAKFREQVFDYAARNGMDVYEGKVTYALSQKEIMELHKKTAPFHDFVFQSFDFRRFLGLLLIKRPAFEYENEVRFFIVPNNTSKGSSKRKFVDVKWEDIINEVRIDKSCTEGEKFVVKQFCESKGIKLTESQKAPMKNNNMMEIYMEDFDINSMEGPYPITIE